MLFRFIPGPETEIETYIVSYFGHLFNESERRAREHLSSEWYLMVYEEKLSRGIAHELARGQKVPERVTSLIPEWRKRLSDDLARTPKARQCRHCKHDWHGSGETPA